MKREQITFAHVCEEPVLEAVDVIQMLKAPQFHPALLFSLSHHVLTSQQLSLTFLYNFLCFHLCSLTLLGITDCLKEDF